MIDANYLIIVITSLALSAFFSGVEIAFITSDKLHIELRSKQGYFSDRILSIFLEKPSRFITAILIGNNLTLVIYGIFMAFLLKPIIADSLPGIFNNELLVFFLQTIIATFIVLVTAEFLPKTLFLIQPNKMLSLLAVPILLFYIAFFPAVWVIVNLSKILIEKVLGLEFSEDKPVFGLIDLNQYIKKIVDSQEDESKHQVDAKIFSNALEFKSVNVRDCLVPRTELVAVSIEDTIEEMKTAFIESGFSKVLVFKESIDNIIGYCNSIELFKKPEKLTDILLPITIVPETIPANELMIQFIAERKNVALVVDEYGGTSGIVTIEDIMEEIFGEIQDEHDEENLLEQKIDDDNFIFSARHEIDYLNDKYGFQLPDGDYETLGGLILATTEDFPEKNAKIHLDVFVFTIESVEDIRIENIRLTIKR